MNRSLVFPEETCKESLMCSLLPKQCFHQRGKKGYFIYNKDWIEDINLHPKNVIDYDKPYYELLVAPNERNYCLYEDELEKLGFSKDTKVLMPWSHHLYRYQSHDLNHVNVHGGSYQCGGQSFIIFQVENGIRKIILEWICHD